MDLRDRERYGRGSGSTGPRLWLHKQGLDGAFLVMHGHKVINGAPGDFFDGTVFEEATSRLEPFVKLAIHGGQGEMNNAKYDLLKAYWAAGSVAPYTAPIPPELEYASVRTWKPKASHLWPAVGMGVLSIIHLSPTFFELDRKKTKVLRRNADHASGIPLSALVSALRVGLATWAATTRAPELPPRRPPVAPRPPRARELTAAVGPSGEADAPPGAEIVGCRISCFWVEDNQWYDGVVDAFEPEREQPHHVTYDDTDTEWVLLLPGQYQLLAAAETGEEMPTSRRRKMNMRCLMDEAEEEEMGRKRVARSGKARDTALVGTAKVAKRTYHKQMQAVRAAGSAGDQFGQLKAALKALDELGKVLG